MPGRFGKWFAIGGHRPGRRGVWLGGSRRHRRRGSATTSVDATPGDPPALLLQRRVRPDYMETFFEEYPDIDLETSAFGSNDEAVAKLLASFEADVVNSCVDEATLEMVEARPVPAARRDPPRALGRHLPVDEGTPGRRRRRPDLHRPGRRRHRPGIMYNADEVTDVPDSWTDLFDPQYAQRSSRTYR